jgi:superfamily II DNA or RNA helicase
VEALFGVLRGVPYLNSVACVQYIPDADGLQPVKITGLAVSVSTAAQWLLDLETRFEGRPERPGQSLKAWSVAAKLLLELLGRGRIIPLVRAEAGVLVADWQVCLTDEGDADRLLQLETALPDACRALVPPERDHKAYQFPTASALLHQFMAAAGGALARQFLAGAVPPGPGDQRNTAPRHWLKALTGAAPRDIPPGLPYHDQIYAAVDAWAQPLTGVASHASLRTGIRLNPPDLATARPWELELLLQTPDVPPVTVPAEAVWETAGSDLTIGDKRFTQPEQRLLADLPTMVRLFPSLAPLAAEVAPARLPINEDDVMALLAEGAAQLHAAGFPVLLPEGLVRPSALRLRMHVRPRAGAAESHFGLNQLVDVQWDAALGDTPLSLDELRRLARQKRPFLRIGGRWMQVDERSLAAALRNIEQYGEQMPLMSALHLAPDVAETSSEGWVYDLLERLNHPAKLEPVPVPAGFVGQLRPYQERGLAWLAFLRRFGAGACLADDMGLGKTIQLIALLLHEREGDAPLATGPTLLVCPVSLVGNWRRELARFAPSLKVMVHHGAGREDEGDNFAEQARQHDVVITTYSLVGRDADLLTKVSWNGIVADEAQNLKNPTTQHAKVLHGLPGGYRVAMTGTPVENHLGDLWSIFHFINPGLLGGWEEFRRIYSLPIERYRDTDAVNRLRRQVGPFILRRLKTDPNIIADLPEKLENTVLVNLSVEQAALYEATVQEMLDRVDEATGIARHGAVLAGLTKLKQICNHPQAALGGPLAGQSGKLERLTEMLREVVEQGDRALLFTQFAQFGARLQPYLTRVLGCSVLYLDGSTPQPVREQLIDRFQAGEAPLFLLSLKAGGVGLNLTAASHVFHIDRWWNPAVEDQATDRAYRIGQTRRVMVYKLVTAGTLEERIDKLLTEKRSLSEQVIGTGEGWLGTLSTDELRALITLERE